MKRTTFVKSPDTAAPAACKKGDVVHIVWLDAEVDNEWREEDDLQDHSSLLCETVGYLINKPTKKSPVYVVASTRSKGEKKDQYNAITKIPLAWVKEIETL